MSEPINDGGPAFPWHQSPGNQNNLGMSLRDWFAGQEKLTEWDSTDSSVPPDMAEALAGRPRPRKGWASDTPEEWLEMMRWEADWRAALKYIRADAMLKARGGGK